MRVLLAAAAALSLAATGAMALPGGMTVAQFLAKAQAVQAKGPKAANSPELKALEGEMTRVGMAYRASPASRPPQSCPPPPGMGHMSAGELLGDLAKIPPARRGISMDAAFTAIMKQKYPCKRSPLQR